MRCAIFVLLAVLLTPAASTQTRLGTPADEMAIHQLRNAHDVAWSNHDAKALTDLFAPDADRATVNGWFSGRAEIQKGYANTFAGAFKDASLANESPRLRFLTADVAMLDVDNIVTRKVDGITVKNHSTSIYVERNGEWTLVANRLIRMP